MIKPSIMYSVICDRCGRILEDGAFWEDESSAIMYALNSKWVEIYYKQFALPNMPTHWMEIPTHP